MNKWLKKIMVVAMAVLCAFSVHISVSASSGSSWEDLLGQIIDRWNQMQDGGTTTTESPNDNTTAPSPGENTTQDPVNSSGVGSVTTTAESPTDPTAPSYTYPPSGGGYYYPPQSTTAPTPEETTTEPEDNSSSYEGSLSDLLESDSAAHIVQTTTEPFTLNVSMVSGNNRGDDNFTWQKTALVAVAVLFMVLVALIAALLAQKRKKAKTERDRSFSVSTDSGSSREVPVEVVTPERIAELLGSAASGRVSGSGSGSMTSAESAVLIRNAALMDQLTHSYSDPLIRKYTDEPVVISPAARVNLDSESLSGSDILKATDIMLNDMEDDNAFDPNISAYLSEDFFDSVPSEPKEKVCPECGKPVSADDVFCHECGAYVG